MEGRIRIRYTMNLSVIRFCDCSFRYHVKACSPKEQSLLPEGWQLVTSQAVRLLLWITVGMTETLHCVSDDYCHVNMESKH